MFFDLHNDKRPHHIESSGLFADSIEAEFELCVTVALNEDIARGVDYNNSPGRNNWLSIEADTAAFKCILQKLISLIGPGTTPQDVSDRNHLSHAIAKNVHAFITRDEHLLEQSDKIYDQFGTLVLRPVDFIVNTDIASSQLRFDRRELSSVRLSISGSIQTNQDATELTQLCRKNEKATGLMAKLRGWRANPSRFDILSIVDADCSSLAMAVIENLGTKKVVHLLRVSVRLKGKRRGRTILRCLVSQLRSQFSDIGLIEVVDEYGVAEASEALGELGFSFHGNFAFKVGLKGVWNMHDALNAANNLISENGAPEKLLFDIEKLVSTSDPTVYLKLEHKLWPAKLDSNGLVSCLTIPIRPKWARALFDPNLGQREFWDEDADLLLNPKNAYYTAARPAQEFGRILWYVSDSKNYSGTRRIRACSQMTGRVITSPLQSYREFRHFGVYQLADIEKLSKRNRADVMAIEFCDTELFANHLPLPVARKVLESPKETFQWPIKIAESKFLEIYRQGIA